MNQGAIQFLFSKARETYEYCQIECRREDIVDSCNMHGRRGWIMCGMIPVENRVVIILVRTKPQEIVSKTIESA